MSGPEALSTHLRNSALTGTLARARELIALERRLLALIDDPELASHCRLANLRDSVLVLEAESPAWATRLRYTAPDLIRRLAAGEFPAVTEVRIRVRPLRQAVAQSVRRAALSTDSAAHLRAAAEDISDAPLAAALRRLAARSTDR